MDEIPGALAALEAENAALDLSKPLSGPMLESAVRWLLLRELARA